MIIPEFTAPGYQDRTLNEVQRCVNMYPEKTPTGYNLVSAFGLLLSQTVANNLPCRGAHATGTGEVYSVHGNTVYKILAAGTAVTIGTISTSSGVVCMASNATQVLLTTLGTAYVITISSGAIAAVVDANFPANAATCAYLDGYFFAHSNGANTFYLSALNDATTWTPASFETAEADSDYIVALISTGEELIVIGARTTEVWYNTGNATFPFERMHGSTMKVGCPGTGMTAMIAGTVFFYGSGEAGRGGIWAVNKSGFKKVSTQFIEDDISDWVPDSSVPLGFCYSFGGHQFYQMTNTHSLHKKTWAYDLGEDAWHERDSFEIIYTYHRVAAVVNYVNVSVSMPFAFDIYNGNVYQVVSSTNSENSVAIRRIKDFGPIGDGSTVIRHNRIEILLEVDHDSSASYTLSGVLTWSDDGGLTFSSGITLSRAITSGTTGQLVRLYANRLGSSRKRIYRWTMTGPAARIILKTCDLDIRAGRH